MAIYIIIKALEQKSLYSSCSTEARQWIISKVTFSDKQKNPLAGREDE